MGLSVLSIHAGQDTGGQGWRIHDAFTRLEPDWTVRSAYNPNAFFYLDYPRDVPWKQADEAWDAADVVHLHNDFRTAAIFERRHDPKPAIIHYHGTTYRADPWPRVAEQKRRGALAIVSTLDLWLINPEESDWLPAPYDLDWLRSFRRPHDSHKIVISHAPTAREIKSTDTLIRAVKRLEREGFPVELDLIEHVDWMTCLKRKGRADIYFDQVKLGYGCNAIEAWGMGIPVVAGGADATLDEMERRFGALPFYHATEETIYDALRELVEDEVLRRRMADIGSDHVARYHDERVVIEQLKDLYRRAAGISEERAA